MSVLVSQGRNNASSQRKWETWKLLCQHCHRDHPIRATLPQSPA